MGAPPVRIRTEGADDLDKVARALKEAADRNLQKKVSKAMREVAKPIGQAVLREGAAGLPRRGGLAAYVAATGRIGISNSLAGKSASVTLALRNKGVRFAAMDRGKLRHPVFGRPDLTRKEWTWTQQALTPGLFSKEFEHRAPEARKAVLKAANETLEQIAKEV